MRRRSVIALAVVLFLAGSFELARYLSASGTERSAIFAVLQDEARGDTQAAIAKIDGCSRNAACQRIITTQVPRLRHLGHVKILLLESGTAYSLSSSTGTTRVAWTVLNPAGPTHVQCVRVHKSWSFLSGASTSLLAISAPIGNEASC